MKRNWIRIMALVLCAAMLLPACGGNEAATTAPTSTAPGNIEYTVTVTTSAGRVLDGIDYIIRSNSDGYIKANGELTNSGKITFTALEGDTFAVSFDGIPEGYTPSTLTIDKQEMTIVLESKLVNKDIADKVFHLGDVMYDFTVTDCNGNQLKLSELLNTKKAVMLNFWFEDCDPCKMEFPYMQQAYEAYSDEIAIIALSPMDTNESIAQFREKRGLSFYMAACSEDWIGAMSLDKSGFPKTVIIDRFGVIALTGGSVDEEGVFEAAFAHFTAENYEQKLFNSLYDCKGE